MYFLLVRTNDSSYTPHEIAVAVCNDVSKGTECLCDFNSSAEAELLEAKEIAM